MVNGYKFDNLKDALEVRKNNKVTPYAGGTDLMVEADENVTYLFLNNIKEIKNITKDSDFIRIGAAVTFSKGIKSGLLPEILQLAASEVGATAIKNAGTFGGNISNGSPKADTGLIFCLLDAKARIVSADSERILSMDEFYLGRNSVDIKDNELLAEILVPIANYDNFYYKKIGPRAALAIARVSFAGIMDIKDNIIINCRTAFGSIDNKIICRTDLDKILIGKSIEEAKEVKTKYLKSYDEAIIPIRGRVSAEYRKSICMNLLGDFLAVNGI